MIRTRLLIIVFIELGFFFQQPGLANHGRIKIYPTPNSFYELWTGSRSIDKFVMTPNPKSDREYWKLLFRGYSRYALQKLNSGYNANDEQVTRFAGYSALAFKKAFGHDMEVQKSLNSTAGLKQVLAQSLEKYTDSNGLVDPSLIVPDCSKNSDFYSLNFIALEKGLSPFWLQTFRYFCFHILQELENGKSINTPELAECVKRCDFVYRKANPGHSLVGLLSKDSEKVRTALLETEEGKVFSNYPRLAKGIDGCYVLKYPPQIDTEMKAIEQEISPLDVQYSYYDNIARHESLKLGQSVVLFKQYKTSAK